MRSGVEMKERISTIVIVSLFAFIILLGYFNLQTESSDTSNPTVKGWLPIEKISIDAHPAESQRQPSIAVENGKVHVVWETDKSLYFDIYYRYFAQGLWQPEQEVSTNSADEEHTLTEMAVSNGKVHVVWKEAIEPTPDGDTDIYYRCFNGTAWKPEQEISIDLDKEHQTNPHIAAEGDKVYVVWENGTWTELNIHYRHYDGVAWQPIMKFGENDGIWQFGKKIAVENGKVHIVFQQNLSGSTDFDIYYKYFDGTIWHPDVEISIDNFDEAQVEPDIAVENGEVHVVYRDSKDSTDQGDIYYRHCANNCFNSVNWEAPIEISTDIKIDDFQGKPSIAAENNKVYVVWMGNGYDWNIYYAYFDSTSWQPQEEISIDIGTEDQWYPDIAVEHGHIHVVWGLYLPNIFDIYYRHYVPPFLPDLEITSIDILFNPASPVEAGIPVLINVTTHNIGLGGVDAFNVVVRLFDDYLGLTQIGSDQIIPFIPNGGIGQVEIEWVATGDVDLDISENDISFNPLSPVTNGSSVMINATIHNSGQTCSHNIVAIADPDDAIWESNEANNDAFKTIDVLADVASVEVKFYDGSGLADMIGNDTIGSIAGGGIAIAEMPTLWIATPLGLHDIHVVVDPDNTIPESNESNNIANKTINVVELPVTTIHVGTPQYLSTNLYVSSSTQFSFTVVDYSTAGIRSTHYRIDTTGDWVNYTATGPFSILIEGVHTIYYNSTDNLGGAEEIKTFEIIVDNTSPTTNIDVGDPNYISSDIWVTSATELTLSATDNGPIPVGLNYTKYRIWNGTWSEWDVYDNKFTLGIDDGIRHVEFFSGDWLGNEELIQNRSLIVDDTPPVTEYILQLEPDNTEVRISLIATDEGCGVNFTKYRIGSGDWVTYSNTFVLNESGWHTIYFWSTDKLGNVENEKNFSVLIEEPGTTIPPGDEVEETNYKPLIALIFTIVLLVVGSIIFYKRPLKIVKGNKWYAWMIVVLPFVTAEIITGIISLLTDALSVPPLLGLGMFIDLVILVTGLIAFAFVVRKSGKAAKR